MKTTKNTSGSYSYTDSRNRTWIIEKIYDDLKDTGFWTYRLDYGYPDDMFCTKKEALIALQKLLDKG